MTIHIHILTLWEAKNLVQQVQPQTHIMQHTNELILICIWPEIIHHFNYFAWVSVFSQTFYSSDFWTNFWKKINIIYILCMIYVRVCARVYIKEIFIYILHEKLAFALRQKAKARNLGLEFSLCRSEEKEPLWVSWSCEWQEVLKSWLC